MTSQLIPVFNGTISNETALLCNARDLHAFLGVKKVFAAWITNRISEYEFIENQDYILLSNLGKQTSGRGGHNRKEYHLTLDTAKELAMVERNEKGRQVRRYFIECEKRLRQQETKVEKVLSGLLMNLLNQLQEDGHDVSGAAAELTTMFCYIVGVSKCLRDIQTHAEYINDKAGFF
ncbi:phage antirepressor Ant [Escherichia coli]|uniref:antA/AntB antirepressor family protein n=1 Tax=Escherichia coli TaxID=562 RepID=UPI00122DE515|nr:antA/AntB antirepressor family protein [Escherichia coli]KAA2027050.1 phage antirepressor Ant [Escherichia coli]